MIWRLSQVLGKVNAVRDPQLGLSEGETLNKGHYGVSWQDKMTDSKLEKSMALRRKLCCVYVKDYPSSQEVTPKSLKTSHATYSQMVSKNAY